MNTVDTLSSVHMMNVLAVSTFLEFFILTQAPVVYIWKGWVYKLIGITIPTTSSPPSTDPQSSIRPPPVSASRLISLCV